MASQPNYWTKLRAGTNSLLPLSTDESTNRLYARVRGRALEGDHGPLDSVKDYTLVDIVRTVGGRRQLLLGMKKRGFGVGKWNGFGGKFDEGETALECAVRETQEECGLTPRRVEWRAQLLFTFRDSGKLMRVHVFEASDFDGEPVETEEMRPQWFDVDAVPYSEMWHDDTFWLPTFLSGQSFEAWYDYAAGGEAKNLVLESDLMPIVAATPRKQPAEGRSEISPP
mmetsp:Transcript_26031/g.81045  ORF Transcript_26031/g.81045 Transcript_26031/m.81045 type:complete len:226 (+) Transcript_26031:231-908(+)